MTDDQHDDRGGPPPKRTLTPEEQAAVALEALQAIRRHTKDPVVMASVIGAIMEMDGRIPADDEPPYYVLADRLATAEADRAALLAALEPFAAYVDLRGSAMPDETLMDEGERNGPTLGDCRRAAEAVRRATPPAPEQGRSQP